MKVAIVGYGKMGRMVEQWAMSAGHDIGARIDKDDPIEGAIGCDVAIEFTEPTVAFNNILALGALGIPTVVGTTGWHARLPEIEGKVEALVYGTNFSIGVNVFNEMVAAAARFMTGVSGYEAYCWEAHHSQKKDAPSGTANTLVERMRGAGYTGPIDMASTRAGMIPGIHEVGFDSAADTITLRHTARSRDGFAQGAVFAAEWIVGKQGIFEFGQVMRTSLGLN